jgi:copper chaperone CopZ
MKNLSILITLLVVLIGCQNKSANEQSALDPENKVTVEMFVSGMTCAGCERTIVNTVSELTGTFEAEASNEDGTARVVYDKSKLQVEDITSAISKKGYTVDSFVIKDFIEESE